MVFKRLNYDFYKSYILRGLRIGEVKMRCRLVKEITFAVFHDDRYGRENRKYFF